MNFLRVFLVICFGCGQSHGVDDAMSRDGGSPDVEVPCPDFSCEARCVGVSVCNCIAPGGEEDCAARGGRCVEGECLGDGDGGVTIDAGLDARADAGVDAGEPTSGVPCGGVSCESPIAVCLICPHEDFTDTHCLPADLDDERWPFRTAMESHPFCGFPGLFIQCDGPEDCGPGQVCVFSGGEWGYAQCSDSTDGPFQAACRSDEDCEPGVRCGEVDPLGYFSPHYERLGWRPYACGGASARASAYCDGWELDCSREEGFYDRAQCLRTVEAWSLEDEACARAHLARGACLEAADETPCAP